MSSIYHESEARRNLRDIAEEQREEGLRREAFSYEDFLMRVDDAIGPRMEAARFVSDAKGQQSTGEQAARLAQPRTFEDTVHSVLDEAARLIIERQRAYGASNIEEQGVLGIVNRITMDKAARIRKRLNGRIVNGEVVLDPIELGSVDEPGIINDAFDFIGYGACLILLLRGEWGKPLADER